jgi:hypothetical protein
MSQHFRNIISIIIGVFFIGLISSCVTTKDAINNFNKHWVGKNFDSFVKQNGMPYRKFQMNNGDIAYLWRSSGTQIVLPKSSSTTFVGNTANTQYYGNNISLICIAQITASKKGVIKSILILKDTLGKWKVSRCTEIL